MRLHGEGQYGVANKLFSDLKKHARTDQYYFQPQGKTEKLCSNYKWTTLTVPQDKPHTRLPYMNKMWHHYEKNITKQFKYWLGRGFTVHHKFQIIITKIKKPSAGLIHVCDRDK